jgi:hypothetical protein
MKKRGRPTKAAADRLRRILTLRLTKEEYEKLSKDAKTQGLKVSEYARKLIVR